MLIYFQTKCRTRYSLAIKLLYFNLLNLRDSYFIPVVSKMVNSPMIKVFKSLNLFYLRYNITAYTCMFPQRVPKRGGECRSPQLVINTTQTCFAACALPNW